MQIDCQFKNLDFSQSFADCAEGRCQERLERFRLGKQDSLDVHITVSREKHKRCVSMTVISSKGVYKASSFANDYYMALELTITKLRSQLRKKRAKAQDHRIYKVAS